MENEWEKEKEKILNSLLGAGQESLDFAVETEVREHVCYQCMLQFSCEMLHCKLWSF